jgi:hypothetical protein
MGTLPFGTLGTPTMKTNLFWVVPRQLTKLYPLINDSKKELIGGNLI